MTERLDHLILVDAHDNPIGTADKHSAHAAPMLHRAFSAFITDGNGHMLLQRRAAGKYHSGGLWANACCSHPGLGEDTVFSAEQRLSEELGITCPLQEVGSFVYLHRFADNLYEYEYDHVLLGQYSGGFAPDPQEIEALRWVTLRELEEELRTAPMGFAPWFITAAPLVLRHLNYGLANEGYPLPSDCREK